jgi:hypothetical protein
MPAARPATSHLSVPRTSAAIPVPSRLVTAQNAQIRMPSALSENMPTSVPNGGYLESVSKKYR